MTIRYQAPGPTRAEIDAMPGSVVVEFGTSWCGHCQAAQPHIAAALAAHPAITHVRIEDGPGRPAGRSFRVKLWPTLVFLDDAREVGRIVRPTDVASVATPLATLVGHGRDPSPDPVAPS